MLVGAFEIKIGAVGLGPVRVDGIFHREDMGRAGIEPDVENVLHLLVIVRIAALAQEASRRRGEPGVGAFRLEGLLDALEHAGSFSTSPVFLSTKIASGTPQARWRDSTQSGRPSTIAPMRFCPRGGYHLVSRDRLHRQLAQRLAAESMNGLSMATNHCGVARKITGALERQLCG